MRNPSYIEMLILEGESQTLDFKYNISDSKKIAKSLVAFANTHGGTLLIGVRDNGSIAGVISEEELFMLEAASEMYSKPKVNLETKDWQVFDKTVLEVSIEASDQKPHYALNEKDKWMAYIRHNDQNILANTVMLKVWKRQKEKQATYLKYRKKEKVLLNYLENNDQVSISQVQKTLQIPRFVAENILVNLICLDIIKINITEDAFTYSLTEQ